MPGRHEAPPTDRPIDPSLRTRVRIYAAIFVVALVVVVVDATQIGADALVPVLACLAGGVLLGVAAARMYALRWDASSRRVVGRLDAVGGVVLALYVLLVVFRGRLVGLWVGAPIAGVASIAALAGIMAGQALGTVGSILRVLGLEGVDPRRREGS